MKKGEKTIYPVQYNKWYKLEKGIIEKIIKEPDGGAQNDINFVANEIKSNLINEIKILQNKTVRELLNQRYLRYRDF